VHVLAVIAVVVVFASCTVSASWSRSATIDDVGRASSPATPAGTEVRVTAIELDATSRQVTATELVTIGAAVVASGDGPAPTGRLTFAEGARVLADLALVDAAATFKNNDLPVGQHDVVVSYAGDATAAPAKAHLRLTITEPVTAPFAGPGPSVAVVGDSITLGSKDDITAALTAAGADAQVVGLYGYTTTSAKPFVDAFIARRPSIVILELGTNDVSEIVSGVPDRTAANLRARLQALTASFPGACVAVTTVTSHRVRGTGAPSNIDPQRWNEVAREHNAWLRATYPNVIEWDDTVHAWSEAGVPLVNDDELHPNAAGAKALASLDRAALARCTGAAPSP
jgi:lysophospholipase L1-like esterase